MNETRPEPRPEPLSERAAQRLLAMAADEGASALAPPRPSLPDRYEIVREIGRGGMGIVYEAIDHQLGRHCAVKTLSAGPGADDEVRRRFAREAQAAARLRHPHIAIVHDATPDYISMQLIDGGPIVAMPGEEPRRIVAMVRDAANALQHAHEQGIVHRDLKPSNLLVENGHVFVVDFGLAKQIDATSSVSLSGAVIGTPAFMPPEQALGRSGAIDPRSDVYGLGATLFCCLRGAPPFAADDLPTLLRHVVESDAPPLGVDADLDLVVAKCLAKEPELRYPTARALAEDLGRWLHDQPVQARRPSVGYRLRKQLRRQRALWRAVAIAVAAAIFLTMLVLVPIVWRESVARTAASEAAALADHTATVLQDAGLFARLGDTPSAQQKLDGGILRVREFLQRHEVARVRYLVSRLLRARGQFDDALAELQRALAAEPDFADARFDRGLMLAALAAPTPEQTATAIADLGIAVPEGSVVRGVDRLFGRAELLRLRGEHRQARELLTEVLEYDSMHVPARLALARVAAALGLGDQARYYWASAVDLQQGYAPFYLAREQKALPTSLLGLEGALVDFADNLRGSPDNGLAAAHRGIVQLRRALRLFGEGLTREAIDAAVAAVADHDATLTMYSDLAPAMNNRAVCHMVVDRVRSKNGEVSAAVAARTAASADLERALALAPMLPEVHCNRGVLALREATLLRSLARGQPSLQRAEAARASFARALELAPANWQQASFCRERMAAAAALSSDGR